MKKEEKTKLTRARIIDLAMKEFSTNGYEKATLAGIVNAGISKGLLYHNFENRDELYMACLERCIDLFISYVKERNADTDFMPYLKCRMEFIKDHKTEARIIFDSLRSRKADENSAVQEILQPYREMNEHAYMAMIRKKQLRDNIDEKTVLEYGRFMQMSLNALYMNEDSITEEGMLEHEETVMRLTDCMLYGIVKGSGE